MDICYKFRDVSSSLWNEANYAHRQGETFHEETLTQRLIFLLKRKLRGTGIYLNSISRSKEAQDGGDWEWVFVRNNEAIKMRLQAKRLYPSAKYEKLHYKNQTEALIKSCSSDGYMPLYCFYNFDPPIAPIEPRIFTCHHDYRLPSYWGCCVADARGILTLGSTNDFGAVHPLTMPFHRLVCNYNQNLLEAVENNYSKIPIMIRDGEYSELGQERTVPIIRDSIPHHISKMLNLYRTELFIGDGQEREKRVDEIKHEIFDDRQGVSRITVFHDRY